MRFGCGFLFAFSSENFLKICLFVSTESTNVTDIQTHRHRVTAKAALA